MICRGSNRRDVYYEKYEEVCPKCGATLFCDDEINKRYDKSMVQGYHCIYNSFTSHRFGVTIKCKYCGYISEDNIIEDYEIPSIISNKNNDYPDCKKKWWKIWI